MTGLGFKHCTQAWFYVNGQAWWLLLAQISLTLAHFNLLPEKHLTPWHREAWGSFPKVRTSRLDHGRTSHSENEIGFFQEFLMQNDFLRAYYLGFDWSGWIALIKSKILIMKGMSWPGSSDKWKAPWVNSWHFATHWFPVKLCLRNDHRNSILRMCPKPGLGRDMSSVSNFYTCTLTWKNFCFSIIFPWPWQPCHCITDRQTITVCSSW